jgi:hypothetical protein
MTETKSELFSSPIREKNPIACVFSIQYFTDKALSIFAVRTTALI